MDKRIYIELIQNQTVLVREASKHMLTRKLDEMGLRPILSRKQVRVVEVITNMKKPVGSVFEGTL